MNFRKKWQSSLLKSLREHGTVEISTRSAAEISYMTELQKAGKIEAKSTSSGVWVCQIKDSETAKTSSKK
jgi:hypothetical protein